MVLGKNILPNWLLLKYWVKYTKPKVISKEMLQYIFLKKVYKKFFTSWFTKHSVPKLRPSLPLFLRSYTQ